jgi:hypothetical protein
MKNNINIHERVIRMVAGVVIACFFIYNNSFWAFLGLIPFITGAVGICPLYSIAGIDTDKGSHA